MDDGMFVLDGVMKSYTARPALGPLTLEVPAGRTTVLIGPSGCGKSTLLRLLIGLVEADAGVITFDGVPVGPKTVHDVRLRTGYVIQDGGLFPHLTARGNVTLMARHLGWERTRIEAQVRELTELTRFPIDGLDRYPHQLSGGQRQRVGLMRGLLLNPAALLLDEPLGALDPLVRAELQSELRDIFRTLGKTVVLVTHDLGEAAFLADRVVLLRKAEIVQHGSPADLWRSPADPFVTRFVQAQRGAHHIHGSVTGTQGTVFPECSPHAPREDSSRGARRLHCGTVQSRCSVVRTLRVRIRLAERDDYTGEQFTSVVLTLRVRIHHAERDDYTAEQFTTTCAARIATLTPSVPETTVIRGIETPSAETNIGCAMSGTCVVGLQWGDEAKGKIVDLLGDQFDYVVRYNGGANAGHTVVANGKTFKLSLLPSGVIRPNVISVIGNGVVVYPPRFLEEVEQLARGGIDVGQSLVLSDHAHVIFPYHLEEERLAEAGADGRIGTTGRGIGPCYQDKVGRRFGIRVGELLHTDHLRERLEQIVPFKNRLMLAFANGHPAGIKIFDAAAVADEYLGYARISLPSSPIRPACCTRR